MDDCDPIIEGGIRGLRVSEAVVGDDAELLAEHPEPAADGNWSLGEFTDTDRPKTDHDDMNPDQ